jgi:hypothetical protein
MFKTMNYTYVFVMEGKGYDPYITTHTALREANGRHLAWQEVAEQWDLADGSLEGWCDRDEFFNKDGVARLVAVFETEPGGYFRSLL